MQEAETGEPFRTLSQTTLEGGTAKSNSYAENMEIAIRTKTFLRLMGYLLPEKQ